MEQKMQPTYISLIEETLLPNITLTSNTRTNPVEVSNETKEWTCIGVGNYAAVFLHRHYPNMVVKVYETVSSAIQEEAFIYRRLGNHPAYSTLIYEGKQYLVLQRIEGITLYEALHKGIKIPMTVLEDVNKGLRYARKKGLNPFDVHGKNVMMHEGKGYVVDVSDFTKTGNDPKWRDLEKAYYFVYRKTLWKYPIPIPHWCLNAMRYGYRYYKKIKKKFK